MAMRFRQGRKAGRTIYVGDDSNPDRDSDTLIGMVDTTWQASFLVDAANEKLARDGGISGPALAAWPR